MVTKNTFLEFSALKQVSTGELFHLIDGTDVQSIRELIKELKRDNDETFAHHVNDKRNDFAVWIRDVLNDPVMANKIEHIRSKQELINSLEQYLFEAEEEELQKFGIEIPKSNLAELETYIDWQLEHKRDEEQFKKKLIEKGWKHEIIEFVLEIRKNPYVKDLQIKNIDNLEEFRTTLELLKKQIILSITEGISFLEIKNSLIHQGWNLEIIDYMFYDVFKPHNNVEKLANYIVQAVKKGKNIAEVRTDLLYLGWSEYLIDSVIYGKHETTNSVSKILHYIETITPEQKQRLTSFLLKMGWNENDIETGFQIQEQQKFMDIITTLSTHNAEQYQEDIEINKTENTIIIYHSKETKFLISEIMQHNTYQKIHKKQLLEEEGEVHVNDEYSKGYSQEQIKKILAETKTIYFSNEELPLLFEQTNKTILLISTESYRTCIFTKKKFPLHELKKIELWNTDKTRKITKYVKQEYEQQVKTFFDGETTFMN